METEADSTDLQVECESCRRSINETEKLTTMDGNLVCEDCYTTCDYCGEGTTSDSVIPVNDGNYYYCESCTSDHTYYCEECGGYQNGGDYYTFHDHDGRFCEYHFENLSHYCERCDETSYYECDIDHQPRWVHDYSYRPDPIFHQETYENNNKLFFGLEMEVEQGNQDSDVLEQASSYACKYVERDNDIAYLKGDGSLECGFEIVTHPMTYSYIMNESMPLWEVLRNLKNDYDMRSWNTDTCGLHIHVSRAGFNGGSHQHKFLQLVYNNRDFFQLLAGRKSDQWATFDDVIKRGQRSFKDKLNRDISTNRYSAVNTNNRKTLEVRIFRGSLNPRFIKSAVDLIHASVEYTRTMSVKDIVGGSLSTRSFKEYILSKSDMYVSLCQRIEMFNHSIQRIEGRQNVPISGVFTEQYAD